MSPHTHILRLAQCTPLPFQHPPSLQYGWTAFHYAAYEGHIQVVTEMMKDSRVDVNATDEVREAYKGPSLPVCVCDGTA